MAKRFKCTNPPVGLHKVEVAEAIQVEDPQETETMEGAVATETTGEVTTEEIATPVETTIVAEMKVTIATMEEEMIEDMTMDMEELVIVVRTVEARTEMMIVTHLVTAEDTIGMPMIVGIGTVMRTTVAGGAIPTQEIAIGEMTTVEETTTQEGMTTTTLDLREVEAGIGMPTEEAEVLVVAAGLAVAAIVIEVPLIVKDTEWIQYPITSEALVNPSVDM